MPDIGCMLVVRLQMKQYIRIRENEFKARTRFNRYPSLLPPREAVVAVLIDEQLDQLTAALLIKELGKLGRERRYHLNASCLPHPDRYLRLNMLGGEILHAGMYMQVFGFPP